MYETTWKSGYETTCVWNDMHSIANHNDCNKIKYIIDNDIIIMVITMIMITITVIGYYNRYHNH